MKKFRKKPVVVEAVQITDSTFDAPHPNAEHIPGLIYDPIKRCVLVPTLEDGPKQEAKHYGSLGDWIIKGVKGEFYPCKPDIFAATYEAVEDET